MFDARERQKQVTKPVPSGAGRATARRHYDAINRVTQAQLPDSNTVDTAYNGLTTKLTRVANNSPPAA